MTMELRQVRSACLLFILASLAPTSRGIVAPVALQPLACSTIQSGMGSFYRWPTANPGMVAPVNVVWNYPVYTNPLQCSFTGLSILMTIPPSFGEVAGFHLGATAIPTASDERYRLTQIAIRKPAQAYSGLGQALTHVMEMVLIHKEVNGNNWANVILPFQVSTNGAEMDIVNPIIAGGQLPSRLGQTGIVMASAVSQLELGPGFDNATFSEFWGTAPAQGCSSKTVNNRFFMRTSTLAIGVDTFEQLSTALQNAAVQDPTQPPETTWTVGTCRNNSGTCVVQKAENMQTKLTTMQKYQSEALTEQRSRKTDLDTKLKELQTHTGPATNASIVAYNAAAAAYTDLKSAASELTSAETNVAQLQLFATEAAGATWDQDAPKSAAASKTPATAFMQQPPESNPSNVIAHGAAFSADTSGQDAAPSVADNLLSRFLAPSRFHGKRRVSV